MISQKPTSQSTTRVRWEYGKKVSHAVISRFARQVVERFQPDKIILFGSYAYGQPHADSDVDILVVMPAAAETNQAVRIRQKTDHPFPSGLDCSHPGKPELAAARRRLVSPRDREQGQSGP